MMENTMADKEAISGLLKVLRILLRIPMLYVFCSLDSADAYLEVTIVRIQLCRYSAGEAYYLE